MNKKIVTLIVTISMIVLVSLGIITKQDAVYINDVVQELSDSLIIVNSVKPDSIVLNETEIDSLK